LHWGSPGTGTGDIVVVIRRYAFTPLPAIFLFSRTYEARYPPPTMKSRGGEGVSEISRIFLTMNGEFQDRE
jgi:hypothetical protein